MMFCVCVHCELSFMSVIKLRLRTQTPAVQLVQSTLASIIHLVHQISQFQTNVFSHKCSLVSDLRRISQWKHHQGSDNGPPETSELSHSINDTPGLWDPSHFFQFFSLWQQIRWIRDYLSTNNSRRNVTNLSLILFFFFYDHNKWECDRIKLSQHNTFLLFGHSARCRNDTIKHKTHVNGFQISTEQTGSSRWVTDQITPASSTQRAGHFGPNYTDSGGGSTVAFQPPTVRGPGGLLCDPFWPLCALCTLHVPFNSHHSFIVFKHSFITASNYNQPTNKLTN